MEGCARHSSDIAARVDRADNAEQQGETKSKLKGKVKGEFCVPVLQQSGSCYIVGGKECALCVSATVQERKFEQQQ